jgi:hypothetical protein
MRKYTSFLLLCVLLSACAKEPPTDENLRSVFAKERAAFEEIKTVLCALPAEQTVMLDPEWSKPAAGSNLKERLYPLFRKVGASGVYYEGDCSFRLSIWSVGLAGGGDYKGISYKPLPYWKGKVVEEPLDNFDRSSKEISFLSRSLGEDWFMYFHHWP